MAIKFAKLRVPIVRIENGYLRPVDGALVSVYDTLASGAAPVDNAGSLAVGATLSSIYTDRAGNINQNNPITSDASGYIETYAPRGEYHFRVVCPDGSIFGMPFYTHIGVFDQSIISSDDFTITALNTMNLGTNNNPQALQISGVITHGLRTKFNAHIAILIAASDPSGTDKSLIGAGILYFNTSDHTIRVWDGTTMWKTAALT